MQSSVSMVTFMSRMHSLCHFYLQSLLLGASRTPFIFSICQPTITPEKAHIFLHPQDKNLGCFVSEKVGSYIGETEKVSFQ